MNFLNFLYIVESVKDKKKGECMGKTFVKQNKIVFKNGKYMVEGKFLCSNDTDGWNRYSTPLGAFLLTIWEGGAEVRGVINKLDKMVVSVLEKHRSSYCSGLEEFKLWVEELMEVCPNDKKLNAWYQTEYKVKI